MTDLAWDLIILRRVWKRAQADLTRTFLNLEVWRKWLCSLVDAKLKHKVESRLFGGESQIQRSLLRSGAAPLDNSWHAAISDVVQRIINTLFYTGSTRALLVVAASLTTIESSIRWKALGGGESGILVKNMQYEISVLDVAMGGCDLSETWEKKKRGKLLMASQTEVNPRVLNIEPVFRFLISQKFLIVLKKWNPTAVDTLYMALF